MIEVDIIVKGPLASGKSRLLNEFAAMLSQYGYQVSIKDRMGEHNLYATKKEDHEYRTKQNKHAS